jgi:dienelactone hydrolase
MIQKISNNKVAILLLHEIYGINPFIEKISSEFKKEGFDVFSPNMLHRDFFTYSAASEAYQFFMKNVGFDYYKKIENLLIQLKLTYEKIYLIGFSVGATIAWQCCESGNCHGIICCYGSRIRDYLSLQPSCPTLLLFAEQDSFPVDNVIKQLSDKPPMQILKFPAKHSFIDEFSDSYHEKQAQKAKECIREFIKNN